MNYVASPDGGYQVTVSVKFKVGDRAYRVRKDGAIEVVNVYGIRITSYFRRENLDDSLDVLYSCRQVNSDHVSDNTSTILFATMEEAVTKAMELSAQTQNV